MPCFAPGVLRLRSRYLGATRGVAGESGPGQQASVLHQHLQRACHPRHSNHWKVRGLGGAWLLPPLPGAHLSPPRVFQGPRRRPNAPSSSPLSATTLVIRFCLCGTGCKLSPGCTWTNLLVQMKTHIVLFYAGGNNYSLNDIENGVLRNNRKPPYMIRFNNVVHAILKSSRPLTMVSVVPCPGVPSREGVTRGLCLSCLQESLAFTSRLFAAPRAALPLSCSGEPQPQSDRGCKHSHTMDGGRAKYALEKFSAVVRCVKAFGVFLVCLLVSLSFVTLVVLIT